MTVLIGSLDLAVQSCTPCHMLTAIIVTLLVAAILAGLILGLRNSAKTGLPPKGVLDRATQRARELEQQEQAERQKHRD
jgi:hypothetical protein